MILRCWAAGMRRFRWITGSTRRTTESGKLVLFGNLLDSEVSFDSKFLLDFDDLRLGRCGGTVRSENIGSPLGRESASLHF